MVLNWLNLALTLLKIVSQFYGSSTVSEDLSLIFPGADSKMLDSIKQIRRTTEEGVG